MSRADKPFWTSYLDDRDQILVHITMLFTMMTGQLDPEAIVEGVELQFRKVSGPKKGRKVRYSPSLIYIESMHLHCRVTQQY